MCYLSNCNDEKFVKALAGNCRVSIMNVARETKQNYLSVKQKIDRLLSRELVSIRPLVSSKLTGRVGAIIRLKTEHFEKVNEVLSKCNRVVGLLNVGDEVVAIVYARDKMEVMSFVNRLMLVGDGLKEFSVEYGELPQSCMVPIKTLELCPLECFSEFPGSKSCLPALSLRNNNKH